VTGRADPISARAVLEGGRPWCRPPVPRRRGRWSGRWLALVLGLALVAAPGVSPARDAGASGPDPATLAELFAKIVDGNEYGAPVPGLARWDERELEIGVVGRPLDDQRAALDALLPVLAAATGMTMRAVEPLAGPRDATPPGQLAVDLRAPDALMRLHVGLVGQGFKPVVMLGQGTRFFLWRAHMIVLFTDHHGAAQIGRSLQVAPRLLSGIDAGSVPCFAHFGIDTAGHVFRYAIVVLRTDLPDWARRRCLHEEIVQSLGLRNDVRGSDLTLFDDQPMRRRTELTPHDLMFLALLYDSRLPRGLTGAALRARARDLITERAVAGRDSGTDGRVP
jgi:hypothetical protein